MCPLAWRGRNPICAMIRLLRIAAPFSVHPPWRRRSQHLLPNYILVVAPVVEGIHLAGGVAVKQNPSFHARTEEQVAGFRKQPGLRPCATLQEKVVALARDRAAIARGKLIGPGELVQTRGIGGAYRRI